MTHTGHRPTLVFDEVDAGIGGGVAEVVGNLLRHLGQQCQVLCVTHLPQVAAAAATHFKIEKHRIDERAVTRVSTLEEEDRETELARMLAGDEIGASARAHARTLLGES